MALYNSDNQANYLNVASTWGAVSGGNPISTGGWVRLRASSGFGAIIATSDTGGGADPPFIFGVNGLNLFYGNETTFSSGASARALTANTWHFAYVVATGTNAFRIGRIDLDGTLTTTTGTVTHSTASTNAFRISRIVDSGAQFNGDIGPIYVATADMTDEEWRAQARRILPVRSYWAAYPLLNTTYLSDITGNGRDATMSGTMTQVQSPVSWGASVLWIPGQAAGGSSAVLEGSSAGTSTAGVDTLRLNHALVGSSAGTSTAGANLSTAKPLAGASDGTSTAGADLLTAKPLAGASAGTSTAGATTLNQTQPLAGASAGTSTAGADLTVVSGAGAVLEGSAAGTSTAAATLRLNHALVGSSAGTSTAEATLRMQHALVASSAGTSTAGADLLTAKPLVGSSAGTSTAGVTTLRLTHPLTASTAGTSTAAATLRMLHPLVGSAAGVATVEGNLNIPLPEVSGLLVTPAIMTSGGATAIVMSTGGATPMQRRAG
jgi:hypothetical protein